MTVSTQAESATRYDAVAWAREHGRHWHGQTARDNYEPTRGFASLTVHTYETDDHTAAAIIDDVSALRDPFRATYLLDDGRTVRPYYVAAWHPDRSYVILHAFPTNYNDDGTRRLRADDGRPVDFTSWAIGPRVAFHVKITSA